MAVITQDLKLKSDPSTIVHPNIESSNIPADAVGTSQIAANSIINAKIADYAVSGTKISAGAISTAKIQDGAVTEGKIASGAVTGAKIAAQTITGSKIASDTIGTTQLKIRQIALATYISEMGYPITSLAQLANLFRTIIAGGLSDGVLIVRFHYDDTARVVHDVRLEVDDGDEVYIFADANANTPTYKAESNADVATFLANAGSDLIITYIL